MRSEFDLLVQSHPAVGTKDVEFDVSGGGILRLGSRDGVMWGFVAARAVVPGTSQPFDFSHAPDSVKLNAQDDQGKPDNNFIGIFKQVNGAWQVVTVDGSPSFYFAPGDVAWETYPCTLDAPFGVLEGAYESASDCEAPAARKTCHEEVNALTKVPASDVGKITKEFLDLDQATKVTTMPDGTGTFTVQSTVTVCK